MNGSFRHILAAGLAVAIIGAGIAATQPARADAVKDRQAAMKSMGKANKELRAAAKKGDKATVEKEAMMIVATAEKLPSLFPKGTDRKMLGEKATRAKPEIWAKWDEFKEHADKLKDLAMKVASAAKGGDLAMASKGVGSACGGCHKTFRGKKAK